MREITVEVHCIAVDGLPPRDQDGTVGKIAFIFDGCVVSGWPLYHSEDPNAGYTGYWEADSDVGRNVKFANVTHWVKFPEPLYRIERVSSAPAGYVDLI